MCQDTKLMCALPSSSSSFRDRRETYSRSRCCAVVCVCVTTGSGKERRKEVKRGEREREKYLCDGKKSPRGSLFSPLSVVVVLCVCAGGVSCVVCVYMCGRSNSEGILFNLSSCFIWRG